MGEAFANLLKKAQLELENSHFAEALDFVELALEIEPRDLVALRGAAALSWELKRLDLAAKYSFRACVEDMNGENFAILLEVSRFVSHYKLARDYMLQLKAMYPQDTNVLTGVSALYERAGYRTQAAQYMLRAFHISGKIHHFNQYAKLFSFRDAPHLRDVLSKAQPHPDSPEEEVAFRMEMTIRSEHAERALRGLGAMAMSLSDLFFQFALPERAATEHMADSIIASQGDVEFAFLAKAMCLIACADSQSAQPYFQHLAEKYPHKLYSNVVFDTGFLRELETSDEDATLRRLPPVQMMREAAFSNSPIIFLSCDFAFYQNFARPMLASINRHSPGAQIHIHIINVPLGEDAGVAAYVDRQTRVRIAVSSEVTVDANREYFHAIRFVRLYQLLKRYQRPMFVTDVDALLHRNIQPTLQLIENADIALMAHAGLWAPWNQFRAGIVGVNHTPDGLNYLRLVALYILTFYERGALRWGIDQTALYVIYNLLEAKNQAPAMHFLGDETMADDCNDDAVIWCKSGNAKFELPAVIEGESAALDSPRVKYMKALEDLGFMYAD